MDVDMDVHIDVDMYFGKVSPTYACSKRCAIFVQTSFNLNMTSNTCHMKHSFMKDVKIPIFNRGVDGWGLLFMKKS